MKRGLTIASFLFALSTYAKADGPFGVTFGSDISSLGNCKKASGKGFYLCSVPRKHEGFQAYLITAWPKIGVCNISTFTSTIQTDTAGKQLRDETDRIASEIAIIYGNNLFIGDTKIYNQFWTLDNMQKQNRYGYVWSKDTGALLKNRVRGIGVYATASGIPSF